MSGTSERHGSIAADVEQDRLKAGLVYRGRDKKHKVKKNKKKRKSRVEDDGDWEGVREKSARKKQRRLKKEVFGKELLNDLAEDQGEQHAVQEYLRAIDPSIFHSKVPGLGSNQDALLRSIRNVRRTKRVEGTDGTIENATSTQNSGKIVHEAILPSRKKTSKGRESFPEVSPLAEIEKKPAKGAKVKERKSITNKEKSTKITAKDKDPKELESVVASMRKGLFSEMTTLDPESFWDDEPLNKKQRRWSIPPIGSPTKDPSVIKDHRVISPQRLKPKIRSKSNAENWELKPGCFRGHVKIDENLEDDEQIEENLAFSSNYIAKRPKGIRLSNLTFQLHNIEPETSHVFITEQGSSLRACSVAKGKVHVTLGDQKFAIGVHGMWRIKKGERCVARNLEDGVAVVHVCGVE